MRSGLLAVVLWIVSCPALAAAACDAAGTDLEDVAAVRRAVESACECDGFSSHRLYVQCASRALDGEIDGGRLRGECRKTVRRIVSRSTCSQAGRTTCCRVAKDGARSCAIVKATKCESTAKSVRTACGNTPFCADTQCEKGAQPACGPELLYSSEGNRLRRFDLDGVATPPLVQDVLIPSADEGGLDINGQICALPDGSGGFVAGEDTGQPDVVPGWGVFDVAGTRIGKLAPTFQTDQPGSTSNAEPFGCAFDAEGRLFTSDVGNQASGDGNGQLTVWFPPFTEFPGAPAPYPNGARSTRFCKLAVDLPTAGSVAIDAQGRVYVTSARGAGVVRFSPPFPSGPDAAGGCGAVDALGSPLADVVQRETFIPGTKTYSGIARRANGNWLVSAVFNGTVDEHDPNGVLLRSLVASPGETAIPFTNGHPQGIAVDCRGDLYYADLQLALGSGGIGPGPNGKVRRVPLDVCGAPGPPEVVREGLAFPDGLGVLPGDLSAAP